MAPRLEAPIFDIVAARIASNLHSFYTVLSVTWPCSSESSPMGVERSWLAHAPAGQPGYRIQRSRTAACSP